MNRINLTRICVAPVCLYGDAAAKYFAELHCVCHQDGIRIRRRKERSQLGLRVCSADRQSKKCEIKDWIADTSTYWLALSECVRVSSDSILWCLPNKLNTVVFTRQECTSHRRLQRWQNVSARVLPPTNNFMFVCLLHISLFCCN